MRYRVIQFLILLLSFAVISACGNQAGNSGWGDRRDDDSIPAVEAVQVILGTLPLEERLSGSVRARNQTEIFAEVSGTIEGVHVDEGDRVSAGDPLVRLRARDFEERVRQAEAGLKVAQARVRQAEANLIRMRANLQRTRTIVERGLGTQDELDIARADFISAEADLDLMTAQRDQAESIVKERQAELADTIVRAPIDGIIGNRNAEIGQQAGTGSALFTLGDVSNLQVNIILTQKMLDYIETDTPVVIYSDTSKEEQIEASISTISPYLNPVTHTTGAEIYIDETDSILKPGMYVTVDVLYGQSEQAPLVPNSAIYRHPINGREGVFVTSLDEITKNPDNPPFTRYNPAIYNDPVGPVNVTFVPVEIIALGRMSSGIRGVKEGDWVVTMGHNLLTGDADQQAIIQPTPWEHIMDLQQMQSRDLLDIIREKQEMNQALNLETN